MISAKPILLFDGVCNLCNKWVLFIIKRDPGKKFLFASLQSEIGMELLQKSPLPIRALETIVLIVDGQYFIYSTATLKTMKILGGVYGILCAFIIIPRFIRDWSYKKLAAIRYKMFGKMDRCFVPTPGMEERFL